MENTVIKLQNVSKKYMVPSELTLKETIPALLRGKPLGKTFWALKEISFNVKRGECIGIIGPNGSGKSTLLKLLAGVTYPTLGSIEVKGRTAPLIELGAGFHADMSGKENIYLNAIILGMLRHEVDQNFNQIVEFSGLQDFIEVPIKKYSSGMYMRLGFSIAIHTHPQILLVDEVLAVGDAQFQEKSLQKIRQMIDQKITIVIVSHDLELIKNYCQKAIYLSHGKMIAFGPTQNVIDQYLTQSQSKTSDPM